MNGVGVLGHQPLPCTASAHSFEATRQTFNCQHCNVTLKGKIQYEAHINSRRHKKTVASKKKKARRTEPSSTPASIIGILKVSVIEQQDDHYLHQYLLRLQRIFWLFVSIYVHGRFDRSKSAVIFCLFSLLKNMLKQGGGGYKNPKQVLT